MQSLVKAALKHHFKHLFLGTVDNTHAAQRFYEKYGFLRIASDELPQKFIKCPMNTVFFKVDCQTLSDRMLGIP